jgi:putative sigma-54 modulation protein
MRIQVKTRSGATVDEELLSRVEKKLAKVGRQVSPLATLEVELSEERNPAIRDSQVAEATLHLKGTTLRANDMGHSINLMAEDLARQVKKHRDKRRGRREAQKAGQQPHPA